MSEISFALDANASALMDTFAKTGSAEGLSFVECKDQNNRVYKLDLECESLGDLLVSDYGHSVLCRLVSPDDVTAFEHVEETAANSLPAAIDFKPFIKDDKFFMKLPFKNDKYRASIDPPFSPAQVDKSPFHQGATVTVDCSVSMWINYSSKTAGLYLNVHKVVVDGGKKKSIKRR